MVDEETLLRPSHMKFSQRAQLFYIVVAVFAGLAEYAAIAWQLYEHGFKPIIVAYIVIFFLPGVVRLWRSRGGGVFRKLFQLTGLCLFVEAWAALRRPTYTTLFPPFLCRHELLAAAMYKSPLQLLVQVFEYIGHCRDSVNNATNGNTNEEDPFDWSLTMLIFSVVLLGHSLTMLEISDHKQRQIIPLRKRVHDRLRFVLLWLYRCCELTARLLFFCHVVSLSHSIQALVVCAELAHISWLFLNDVWLAEACHLPLASLPFYLFVFWDQRRPHSPELLVEPLHLCLPRWLLQVVVVSFSSLSLLPRLVLCATLCSLVLAPLVRRRFWVDPVRSSVRFQVAASPTPVRHSLSRSPRTLKAPLTPWPPTPPADATTPMSGLPTPDPFERQRSVSLRGGSPASARRPFSPAGEERGTARRTRSLRERPSPGLSPSITIGKATSIPIGSTVSITPRAAAAAGAGAGAGAGASVMSSLTLPKSPSSHGHQRSFSSPTQPYLASPTTPHPTPPHTGWVTSTATTPAHAQHTPFPSSVPLNTPLSAAAAFPDSPGPACH